MKILDEFSQNLKDNLAQIEINTDRSQRCEKRLDEFINDDVFKNSWNNYANIYTQLMEIKRVTDMELRPKFDHMHHEIHHRVTSKRFKELKEKFEDSEIRLRNSNDRLDILQANYDELKTKLEEIKARGPAARRPIITPVVKESQKKIEPEKVETPPKIEKMPTIKRSSTVSSKCED